ncbi:hypothetical protein HJ590_14860 [Naumannella sp. ID2617S]|nr:hypothetical protein [Naumannella sp. ID2617S]
MGPATPRTAYVDRRVRFGALAVIIALACFAATVAVSLGTSGTSYIWYLNLISDLGDGSCRTRGGRWICSPGFAIFNAGLMLTGVLLVAAAGCLHALWGRVLAGGVGVMGGGLVVAGVFPAGDDGALHLVGVVLALVVPGAGLLLSGIRPGTPWLRPGRVRRGVLGGAALVLCAESRLPVSPLPRGAGELVIVGCLLLALLWEAARVLGSWGR